MQHIIQNNSAHDISSYAPWKSISILHCLLSMNTSWKVTSTKKTTT